MKLHLPKSLLIAVLAAIFAPLGANGANGWDGNTYKIDTDGTIESVNTSGHADGDGAFIRANKADAEVTINSLLHANGYKLILSGDWGDASKNIKNLTINTLTIGEDGNGSADIQVGTSMTGNRKQQIVHIESVIGDVASLTIGNVGVLTLDSATISGDVTNSGTLTLGDVEINGTVTNSGTLKLTRTLAGSGSVTGGRVEIDTTGNLSFYDGMAYKYANSDTANDIKVGFITGEQTFRIFGEGVSYSGVAYDASGNEHNVSDGSVTMNVGNSTIFYVDDSWNYNVEQSAGASAFYVTAAGEMAIAAGRVPTVKVDNHGTVVLEQGEGAIVLNKIVGQSQGAYKPSVISNAVGGNLVISNSGNKTLNSDITLGNGGKVTLSGGTFGTSSSAITQSITSSNTVLAFEDIDVYIGSGKNEMLDISLEVGKDATLTLSQGDRMHYTKAHTLKVLTGGTVELGATRQTLAGGYVVEMAGGVINGTGDQAHKISLDFYKGGTVKATENSIINAHVGGHDDNATIEFNVAGEKTLTLSGNLVQTGVTKSGLGTLLYQGAAFSKALSITEGVFDYNVAKDAPIIHTGSISGAGTFRKSGEGTLILTGAAGTSSNTLGTLEVTEGVLNLGSAYIANGVELHGGQLNIGSDITLGGAINLTGGVLNLGEGHTITISDLDGFAHEDRVSGLNLAKTENGFGVESTYHTILSGANVNNVSGAATYKLGTGEDAHDIVVTDGYYIEVKNTAPTTTYVINTGTVSSAVEDATGYLVWAHEGQAAGCLNITSDFGGTVSYADILTNARGNGIIKLETTVKYGSGASTKFEGVLEIATKGELQLGRAHKDDGGGYQQEYPVDYSSLSALNLNGGKLSLFYVAPSLKSMTVEKNSTGSTIYVNDTWSDKISNKADATYIEKLQLDAALTIETYWKSNINIGLLTGTANLEVKQTNGDEGSRSKLWIDGVEDYSGTITLADGKYDLMLNLNKGESIKSSQIEVVSPSATITLTGSGVYDMGSNTTLNVSGITDAQQWNGVVKISDASIGGLNIDSYGNASSAVEFCGVKTWMQNISTARLTNLILSKSEDGTLNGLTITGSSKQTYNLNGSVSGNGDFIIATGSADDLTYAFHGDLSAWDGKIRVDSADNSSTPTVGITLDGGGDIFVAGGNGGIEMNRGGIMNVTIGNAAEDTTMNGVINNNGDGTLNLTVGTATAAGKVTFNGAIGAYGTVNLAVAQGGTASLASTFTNISNITGGGNVQLLAPATDGAAHSFTLSVGDYTGRINIANSDKLTANITAQAGKTVRIDGTHNIDKSVLNFTLNDKSTMYGDLTEDYTIKIATLTVNGTATFGSAAEETGSQKYKGYQGRFTINNLTSDTTNGDDTIIFASNSNTTRTTIFDLEGGSFSGNIMVKSINTGDNRRVALNLNSATAAQNAVIELITSSATDQAALAVVQNATVRGIEGTDTSGYIIAGEASNNLNKADFDSTVTENNAKTLTINTQKGDNFVSSATIKGNLNLTKKGEGSQTFDGDFSGFNGQVTVEQGTLAFLKEAASLNVEELIEPQLNVTELNMKGGTLAVSGTVNVAKDLRYSGGLIEANLALQMGTALTLSDSVALDGGELRLSEEMTLGGTLKEALSSLINDGVSKVVLFEGIGSLYLGDTTDAASAFAMSDEILASQYFENLEDSYILVYDTTVAGKGTLSIMVPEPTTATLSLIALAALAARRRRK